jgi:prepilin-type N-terminal cleavage/methylation domain-containing protein
MGKTHAEHGDGSLRDAGSTLIEVIVAMVLLGILATVTLPFFITGIRVTADDSARTTATAQVSAVLEELRSQPDCAHLPGMVATLDQPVNQTRYDARHRAFTLYVSVTYAGSSGTCTGRSTATVTATATRGSTNLSSASTIVYLTS